MAHIQQHQRLCRCQLAAWLCALALVSTQLRLCLSRPLNLRQLQATDRWTLVGCTYRVRPGDTLASIAASLNVDIDTILYYNMPTDITSKNYFSDRAGNTINIPCPGTVYKQFWPIQEAGCFFDFTLNTTQYPTLLSIALNPPVDTPGPFTVKGIWTANYQSLGIDLTKPGVFRNGMFMYLPTCGHTSSILAPALSRAYSHGCEFNPPSQMLPAAPLPITLSQLAKLMHVSVTNLQDRNPGKGLTPDTVIVGDSSVPDHSSITIPCPA